jgi:DNA-binding MarR family transcriptional regulator
MYGIEAPESNISVSNYSHSMTTPDHVDLMVAQWRTERPDLELDAMATIARLARLNALAGKAVAEVFDRHGLSVGEFDVLAALRRGGRPFEQRPTQLSTALMLSPAGMTNRLDRLEEQGWIERRPDPDDRRGWIIGLSDDGRALIEVVVADHVDNEERILSPLTKKQRTALDDAVRTLLIQFET